MISRVTLLRATEETDGSWTCSSGQIAFDRHGDLAGALTQLEAMADTMCAAKLIIERLDGSVENCRSA